MTFGPRAEGPRAASLDLVSNASNSEASRFRCTASALRAAPKPASCAVDLGRRGAVGEAGSASASAGTFTIAGAGADIWGTSDAFRFAYIQLPGDGTIVARVGDGTECRRVDEGRRHDPSEPGR